MIRSQYLSTLALAALIGAAPAFAQTSGTSDTLKEPTSATQPGSAKAKPAKNRAESSAMTAAKPLCSELNHPNAGKLADKDTGRAKDNSSSAVHMDCIADSPSSASSPSTTGSASGMAAPTSGAATTSTDAASSTATSSSNPSATGSSASSNSAVAGSASEVNSSVTGSNSTFTPSIDLRGRSSLTIDNNTTTGGQSLNSNTTTTTGDQSLSNTTSATTGDQSLNSGTSASSGTGAANSSTSSTEMEKNKGEKK